MDFYFDFVSPYAYLAWHRARRLLRVPLVPRPLLLGVLLSHFDQRGPAEIAPKRAFTIRDTLRRAAELGLPMTWPERHPFKSVRAARVVLASPDPQRAVDALFDAAWARGADLEDDDVIAAALSAAGLDARSILTRASTPEIAAALRQANQDAIALGVFGVPIFVADQELFFGDDQVERVQRHLEGNDPLDHEVARRIEARPLAVVRRGLAPARASSPRIEIDAEKARHIIGIVERARFVTDLGVRLERIAEGVIESSLEIEPRHCQQDGFVHAGVQATLADHTAGACAVTTASAGTEVLTIEFKVNLLRPSTGPRLLCVSRTLRAGRSIAVVESEVFDVRAGGNVLVSKATATLALRVRE